MIYSYILYEKKPNHTALITLNRPEKRNPLIPKLREELIEALKEAEADEGIKVIVLTGSGKAFSAGGDIENFAKRISNESQSKKAFQSVERIGAWGIQIARIDKPIIAAINGVAAGAGISVALLCDIRIASDQAKFITSFTRIGLIPDVGLTYLLPKVIGIGKALELFYTAGMVDAQEAYRLGLINKIVPHERLVGEALTLASQIAKGPQNAIRLIKRAVFGEIASSLIGQIELESVIQNICFSTEEHREGVRAFFEKREPLFRKE
jgi:2-(1,2-epoxy-1,2-dihydrophenyl)acetyl-CoA isomerase